MKTLDEDSHALHWCGRLGHEYVGICGQPGERYARCEATSLESAIAAFLAGDIGRAVYRKIGPRKWERAWEAD